MKPLCILAHRGNLTGPQPEFENSPERLALCYDEQLHIEFDIRRSTSGETHILSHNVGPAMPGRSAQLWLTDAKVHAPAALNIKDLGSLDFICKTLRDNMRQSDFFLFDFELLLVSVRQAWDIMRELQADGFQVAYRCSDRMNTWRLLMRRCDTDIIWCDELDMLWLTEKHVQEATALGKRLFVCSPDITPMKEKMRWEDIERRFFDLVAWGVEGICTDYGLYFKAVAARLRGL